MPSLCTYAPLVVLLLSSNSLVISPPRHLEHLLTSTHLIPSVTVTVAIPVGPHILVSIALGKLGTRSHPGVKDLTAGVISGIEVALGFIRGVWFPIFQDGGASVWCGREGIDLLLVSAFVDSKRGMSKGFLNIVGIAVIFIEAKGGGNEWYLEELKGICSL
ncbi:hypothetical protein QBC43DRAFT_320742 [Cladorrhinum sp. PSN259]|nr:hypothetical protein QBC43DRAFT_320742 [Cladorrhinum sp. PSN259]